MKSHEEKKTKFTKVIRLRPEQLKWLKENKDTKTLAGYLDKIINHYKLTKKK